MRSGSLAGDGSAAARLRSLAADAPGDLALSGRDGYVRYRELDQAADRVAGWLLARLGRGRHRVGLCAAADHAALVAALGVARSGKICVPLDPSLPLTVLDALAADATVSVVLSDLADVIGPDSLDAPLAAVSECVQPGRAAPVADPRTGASSTIAYCDPYADPPAGIVMSDAGVLRWGAALGRAGVAGPGVRCAVGWSGSAPGALERLVALALSGSCAVTAATDQELAALLDGGNADSLLVSAPGLRRLCAMGPPGADAPGLSAVGVWGGPAGGPDLAAARARLGEDLALSSFYAPAEAGVVACCSVSADDPAPAGGSGAGGTGPAGWHPAGWCLPDVEVEIVDAGGCRVADGQSGHVVVWGPDLPGAYWANPALTELRWLAGPGGRRWCRTGDRGRWDERGRLLVGPGTDRAGALVSGPTSDAEVARLTA